MGNIGCELPLAFKGGLKPANHVIERCRQSPNLVHLWLSWDALGKIPGSNLFSRRA